MLLLIFINYLTTKKTHQSQISSYSKSYAGVGKLNFTQNHKINKLHISQRKKEPKRSVINLLRFYINKLKYSESLQWLQNIGITLSIFCVLNSNYFEKNKRNKIRNLLIPCVIIISITGVPYGLQRLERIISR